MMEVRYSPLKGHEVRRAYTHAVYNTTTEANTTLCDEDTAVVGTNV